MTTSTSPDLTANLSFITAEITGLVARLDLRPLSPVVTATAAAPRVFVVGSGRSGLVMRMAAMRLMHLGLDVHVVGETTTPAIRAGDLLLTASGSGSTPAVVGAARTAAGVGARVAAFTIDAGSALAEIADFVVVIPAQAKTDHGGTASRQYSGSLFEQGLLLSTEVLFQSLWDLDGSSAEQLWPRHANLE